ncbi:hypothetical protein O6H91_03G109700 [Diphasiastrum complanatum]|uniref:Uncharacterized protein n=1 Tax=Diphasiastrum complanatum TaxID=34168 RepID=A0ACC2EA97_DIPCM|nr:hypothetical protein O6H91_03G109700 [Diphasiastrum complanatum]
MLLSVKGLPSFSRMLSQRPELLGVRQQAFRTRPFHSGRELFDMTTAKVPRRTRTRRYAKFTKKGEGENDHARQETSFGEIAVTVTVESVQSADATEDGPQEDGLDGTLEKVLTLEKAQKLATLSVMELRKILKQIHIDSTGRKQELIQELKSFLARHQASMPSGEVERIGASKADIHTSKERLLHSKESAIVKGKRNDLLPDKMKLDEGKHTSVEHGNSLPGKGNKLSPSNPEGWDNAKVTGRVSQVPNSKRKPKLKQHTEDQSFERPSKSQSKGKRLKTKIVEISAELDVNTNIDDLDQALNRRKPWSLLVHKNPQPEWVCYDPTCMRPVLPCVGTNLLKLMSWNVNGLRALLKVRDEKQTDATLISQLAESENFDVLCLQETKLQEKDVEQIKGSFLNDFEGSFWICSTTKLGYSGSALISRKKPLSIAYGLGLPDHDGEGRVITAEFESFFLVSAYVPNSGAKLERLVYRTTQWDPAFSSYLKELEKRKPVVLTGDLNCAYQEIDIHDPNGNRRSAGFTDGERLSFESQFLKQGLLDTFRRQHPNAVAYTYWGYRSGARPRNKGWRLDYFLVSSSIADQVHDSYTSPHVGGSDHCPIGLILKL